jgi:hypothetical protein
MVPHTDHDDDGYRLLLNFYPFVSQVLFAFKGNDYMIVVEQSQASFEDVLVSNLLNASTGDVFSFRVPAGNFSFNTSKLTFNTLSNVSVTVQGDSNLRTIMKIGNGSTKAVTFTNMSLFSFQNIVFEQEKTLNGTGLTLFSRDSTLVLQGCHFKGNHSHNLPCTEACFKRDLANITISAISTGNVNGTQLMGINCTSSGWWS